MERLSRLGRHVTAAADGAPTRMRRTTTTTAAENERPGSRDWQLTRVGCHQPDSSAGGIRSTKVEGYCSAQSVRPAQSIGVMVSADPAAPVLLEVFRMGFYQGRGARLVATLGPFDAAPQPPPERGPRGIRACQWPAWVSVSVGEDWISGVYIGRLSTRPGSTSIASWQSYVIFVVTDDKPADVLFQVSDNTWQAYNQWPENDSLYRRHANGTSLGDDFDVSFNRPYGKQAQYESVVTDPLSIGSGEFLSLEFPAVYWLEQQGLSVRYVSNSDLTDPAVGAGCRAFLSLGVNRPTVCYESQQHFLSCAAHFQHRLTANCGCFQHDEYWDLRQFESVCALRDGGMSLCFLSGNSVCWVSPLTDRGRTLARRGRYGDRAHVGAKDAIKQFGPFPIVDNPDEGLLMGSRNTLGVMGGGDWRCEMPEHWLFAETGMERGECVPGLVGWEFHADPPTTMEVPGLTVVGCGEAFLVGETAQPYTATVYPVAAGANAGTVVLLHPPLS